jgi:hypothetical protein
MNPTSTRPKNQAISDTELRAHNHALRVAARARLDALADFDPPDNLTPLEILESRQRKRLAAALRRDVVLDRIYATDPHAVTDDDRREKIEAMVALELAEAECNLFLDHWLEANVPDESAIGSGSWSYVFAERNRWRAELEAAELIVPLNEWEWMDYYCRADRKRIRATFDCQWSDMECRQLEAASEWVKQHYYKVARQHPDMIPSEVISYIEGLDYRQGVERKVGHVH